MGNKIDLSGQISGSLKAIKYIGGSKWLCKCIKCGNEVTITTDWFQKNRRLGREGCKHSKKIQIGDKFGFLTVISKAEDYVKPKSKAHEPAWNCICSCGRTKKIIESNLKSNKSLSCGLCSNRVSIPEKAIAFYLKKCFENVIENYRPVFLNGKEIDIYLPSLKVGVEYDGVRWHKDINDDLEKNKLIVSNGIDLIRIREKGCPVLDDDCFTIITSRTTNNGTHMTQPIKELLSYISVKYNVDTSIEVDCLKDNADICKTLVTLSKNNSIAELFPELCKEWDFEKNEPLTPVMISAHSGRKVWWKCPKGHSFSSVVASRTGHDNCSCPVCSRVGIGVYRDGKYIGEHSLEKERPDISVDFYSEKNGINAFEIPVSSNKKVWWKCHVCDGVWEAKVNNRTSSLNTGCPYCSKHLNIGAKKLIAKRIKSVGSLLDNHPELCKEWDYSKNDLIGVYPNEITSGSQKKVWWKCETCGYEWQTTIANRALKGSKCKRCRENKNRK